MGWLKKVIGGLTGANAMKRAQEAAIHAQQEAEKRNVTVQSVAADPAKLDEDAAKLSEEGAQNARRRRFSLANTVRGGGLLSSGLLGGRKTLG